MLFSVILSRGVVAKIPTFMRVSSMPQSFWFYDPVINIVRRYIKEEEFAQKSIKLLQGKDDRVKLGTETNPDEITNSQIVQS